MSAGLVAATKFRKTAIIEAMPWDGTAEGATPIIDWILSHDGNASYHHAGEDGEGTPAAIFIRTMEGQIAYEAGYVIIRGPGGEFYGCDGDVFAATYEPA